MKKNQWLWISLLVLILGYVLQQYVYSPANPTPTLKPISFKVAMLFPGKVNDNGWNQAGFDGLKLIEKELGAQTIYSEQVTTDKAQKALLEFIKEGAHFIIVHSLDYTEVVKKVAEHYPRIKFAVVSGYFGNNKNLGSLSFKAGEMGYLAGVVAALKTHSNKIAYIGGKDFPVLQQHFAMYRKGAQSINPNIVVDVFWLNSWEDKEKAKKVSERFIVDGYDVLLGNADTASLAVFEAAKQAGIYAIAVAKDQHAIAPNTIITSIVLDMSKLIAMGAELVQQGRWQGMQYQYGMQDDVQSLAPFYGALSKKEEAIVNQIKIKIVKEEINTSF
jgi:basic membrane protein A